MGLETAAILGIASLVATAGTTVASGAQATKQRKIMEGAEGAANKYMESARDRLNVNTYEELSVNTDIYDKERDNLATVGESYVQLTSGQDRAGSNVQNVVNALQAGNEKISMREAKEVDKLNLEIADEETRLLDIGTQLDLGEVAGAQQKAADAEAKATAFKGDFVKGLGNTVMAGIQLGVPLYQKSAQVKQLGGTGAVDLQAKIGGTDFKPETYGMNADDVTKIAGLSGTELNEFLKTKLSGGNMKNIFDPTKGNTTLYSPPKTNQLAGLQTDNIKSKLGGLGLDASQLEQIIALLNNG
tara:strand:+ start:240 stop:1142 length:903 start_codon:yes stop_codon:yes gene_type:complete